HLPPHVQHCTLTVYICAPLPHVAKNLDSPQYYPSSLFFCNNPPPTEISTLSLHDALPISISAAGGSSGGASSGGTGLPCARSWRSEEPTAEIQSLTNLVCPLIL